MNGEPEVPKPIPKLARGALWIVLSIPPLLTLSLSLLMASLEIGFFLLAIPLVVLLSTFGLGLLFTKIVAVRYRENSLIFLSFSYFFGQIILCLALWFGMCLIFSNW